MLTIDKIVRIEDQKRWNQLLEEFVDSNHTWNYSKIVQNEKKIEHVAVYSQNKLIALFQTRIKVLPLLGLGIVYIFKGPIWQKKHQQNKLETLTQILIAIKDEYLKKQILLLRIRPLVYSDQFSENNFISLINGYFRYRKVFYKTLILDLNKSLEEIRKKFKQKWRNHLAKSERNGLQIVRGSDSKLFDDFIQIYNQMITRKKFKTSVNIYAVKKLNEILDYFYKLKIIVSYKDSIPVSGIIFSCLGETGISIFRATNDQGMKLCASYLIQYETIKWLMELGAKRYDLGGIDPGKNPNVFNFKAGITTCQATDFGIIEAYRSKLLKGLSFSSEYLKGWAGYLAALIGL